MSKLPFVASIFWKVLVSVAVLIVLTFVVFVKFFDYELSITDTGGATITGLIFSYLVHLWMLPAEQLHPDEEYDDYDGQYDEGEEDDGEDREDDADQRAGDDSDDAGDD